MRNHHDGAPLLVEFAQQAQHDFFILCVQIAGGLVSEHDLGIIDERSGNADSLLLTSGQL